MLLLDLLFMFSIFVFMYMLDAMYYFIIRKSTMKSSLWLCVILEKLRWVLLLLSKRKKKHSCCKLNSFETMKCWILHAYMWIQAISHERPRYSDFTPEKSVIRHDVKLKTFLTPVKSLEWPLGAHFFYATAVKWKMVIIMN